MQEARELRQLMKNTILDALCLKPKNYEVPSSSDPVNGQQICLDISKKNYPPCTELKKKATMGAVDIEKPS